MALAAVCAWAVESAASEGRGESVPRELEGVDIVERLGAAVPTDLRFTDESGRAVTLAELLHGERPVILTLNYYRCPMLCTLVLNGLVEALRGVEWKLGDRYDVVTVSIDPTETPELARAKRDSYLASYGSPAAPGSWRFLTGQEAEIRRLADAVGFQYRRVEATGDYAHAAAIFVLTPDGRVSRYLYGVRFEPATLRLALVEASEGRLGNVLDRVILYCYHYDSAAGKYAPTAMRIMRIGGALTVIVLGAVVLSLWRADARRRRYA